MPVTAPTGRARRRAYRRREPENTALYHIVADHLPAFLERLDSAGAGAAWPGFVGAEFEAYLRCGLLVHGFCRVHCATCGHDALVGFSCKGRGFCPSCGGRRMAETAAHLVDHVLPPVAVRQWVLTLPFSLRYRVAFDAGLLADVRRRAVRAIFRFQRAKARCRGIAPAHPGAVVFVQRFGSAVNLAPHLHALVLDGVFDASGRFHRLAAPTDDEVAEVIARIVRQVTRGDPDEAGEAPLPFDSPSLGACYGASVQRRVAFGPASGARCLGRQPGAPFLAFSGPRCAALAGFTLHANTRVSGRDRDALERLCRYACRPAVATERLHYERGGRVTYRLRRPWSDGTHTLDFDPLAFLERLAALVPPPRANLVTYHGVFAPNHTLRETVVRQAQSPPSPFPAYRRRPRGERRKEAGARATPGRTTWAELLARVFLVDVLTCPRCNGRRQIIAMITDPPVITAILECLHLFPYQLVTDPPHAPP